LLLLPVLTVIDYNNVEPTVIDKSVVYFTTMI